MSKRALKKYLADLDKEPLEEQIMDLYERIPQVKKYYDFVFNPKEDKLVEEAKLKISNEYFPTRRKRARKRRSVAQNYIKQFKTLGVDPKLVSDVMLYNIEIAQTYTSSYPIKQESFYKSMYNSFQEALQFITYHHLLEGLSSRIEKILEEVEAQEWVNASYFYELMDRFVD
jgi:superfamily I DNA/RNA helicase